MKIIKNLFLMWALMVCGFVGNAQAAGWVGPNPISYVHPWSSGFSFILYQVSTECGGQNPNQFNVSWSDPNAKQLYALVLMALTTGDPVGVNYSCANGLPVTNDIDIYKSSLR